MVQKKLINDYNPTTSPKLIEITKESLYYPCLLKCIKKSPDTLYAKGNINILNKPSVAIVGTRKPSKEGKNAAKEIASDYGRKGFVIVSGLAKGVDSIAMKSALDVDAPVIGVLPSTLDNIVPKKNATLAKEIIEYGGLLITERNEGSSVRNYHYINRNRIISGISTATIVIETDSEGGTMRTVEFAEKQVRTIIVADLPAEGNKKLKKKKYPVIPVN